MWVAAVVNDEQTPYHDPAALDVAGQIIEAAKVNLLVQNGDWADMRAISRYPLRNKDPRLFSELKNELATSRERFHTWVKGIKPKKVMWLDGNHEFRLHRAFNGIPNAFQILDLPEVDHAMSIPSLFRFAESKIPIEYIGEYPQGAWLRNDLAPEQNVYVEHGYSVRKKPAYTASNLADDRWCSVIVGHCEKLAGPIWTRKLGRHYFYIENGNMSIIGEPGKGNGIYGGIPHSVPEYMNHTQGFSLLFHDGKDWHPFTIRISKGKAFWDGKLYRA